MGVCDAKTSTVPEHTQTQGRRRGAGAGLSAGGFLAAATPNRLRGIPRNGLYVRRTNTLKTRFAAEVFPAQRDPRGWGAQHITLAGKWVTERKR